MIKQKIPWKLTQTLRPIFALWNLLHTDLILLRISIIYINVYQESNPWSITILYFSILIVDKYPFPKAILVYMKTEKLQLEAQSLE